MGEGFFEADLKTHLSPSCRSSVFRRGSARSTGPGEAPSTQDVSLTGRSRDGRVGCLESGQGIAFSPFGLRGSPGPWGRGAPGIGRSFVPAGEQAILLGFDLSSGRPNVGHDIDGWIDAGPSEDLLEAVFAVGRDLDPTGTVFNADDHGMGEVLESLPARRMRHQTPGRTVEGFPGLSHLVLEVHVDESGQEEDMAQSVEPLLFFGEISSQQKERSRK